MVQAWKRLGPWLPGATPPTEGDAALDALAAVTEVRRVLERAELRAVRAARRAGRSWTEIATMLAITRQSAWERWRDLDDEPATAAGPDLAPDPVDAAVAELGSRARRRRTVAVPDVTGFTVAEALGVLTGAGLDAESATPDIALSDPPGTGRPAVVVRQYPDSGTRVRVATTVRLWLERGDGEAGVREPRRPSPLPRSARAEYDERATEAVG